MGRPNLEVELSDACCVVAALPEEAAKTGTDAFTWRDSGATVVDLWIRETSKD